ncbi:MAG: glycosyltransferase family 4 protein [Candidatus Aegiribacteria sp.]|nr:glycosyltransferase family 4 protein [Candidatus Aegiribacteria sp.]
MRIGLEISPLAINASGIPNYILRLLHGFASVDKENQYFLYTNKPVPFDLALPDNFRTVIVKRPLPRFQLWFQMALPLRLRKDKIDVFHGLFSRLPFVLPVPGVITIHDLSGYKMPGLHKRKTHFTNLIYPLFAKKASRIIAVSEFTSKELSSCFPEVSSKTTVIYEAAPPEYSEVTEESELDRVREKYNLPSHFFLFLGTLEPRKNLPRLMEAFLQEVDSIPHSLIISGAIGWKTKELFNKLKISGAEDRIKLTGFVDREDIPALLSLAGAFIYPSLYEGFGLPVLEAMACGTPVITSNVSSMPEIAGDAALLVDPLSTESIANAISILAHDEGKRTLLRERGLERAGEFSWEETARKTLEVYRLILSEEKN